LFGDILLLPSIFKPKKVGIAGGTRISKENEKFCKILGTELSKEKNIVLITGGFKNYDGEEDIPSTDYAIAQGFINDSLISENYSGNIETIVPDPSYDPSEIRRFSIGDEIILKNRNLQSRRFFVVNRSDVLIAIEGAKGTREMIDLAFALEKPCFPLPFTDGYARKRWDKNREYLINSLEIKEEIAREFETVDLSQIDEKEMRLLACTVKCCIMNKLRKKCFIIMPFDILYDNFYDHVNFVLKKEGFEAIRTDKTHLLGNILDMIRQGVFTSDCIIAEITELKPNVMYEIGLAHAFGKPVIMFFKGKLDRELPFDIKNERVFSYNNNDDIEAALTGILKMMNKNGYDDIQG
jgi:nucleoside 2-deoxyribosyltransferase